MANNGQLAELAESFKVAKHRLFGFRLAQRKFAQFRFRQTRKKVKVVQIVDSNRQTFEVSKGCDMFDPLGLHQAVRQKSSDIRHVLKKRQVAPGRVKAVRTKLNVRSDRKQFVVEHLQSRQIDRF